MKNALRIISVVLVAALLFGIGYGMGSKKGIQINVNYDNAQGGASNATVNTNTPPVTTTAPATQAPTTQAPAKDEPATDAPKADTPAKDEPAKDEPAKDEPAKDEPAKDEPQGSSVPSTPEEVVAKYNEVINNAKKEQNVTIHKTQNITLECTDCSLSMLTGAVTSLLGTFMKPVDETYVVSGGVDSQGKTTNDFILPQGRDAKLTVDGDETATATASGDGYVINLKFKSETSTFDGTNTVNPVYHESAMIPLNLATLELPAGASISEASMSYPGATIEATVNGDGKLAKVVLDLPMEGSGSGGYRSATLSVGVKGAMAETYELTY